MVDNDEAGQLEFRNDPDLPAPPFPGSHMVLDDDYVFVSGLVAADVIGSDDGIIGDVAAETKLVLGTLRRMLQGVDCGMDRVVRVDVHLADLRDIGAMDQVYRQFFEQGRYPARTCTESPRLCGNCRVEITLLARRVSAQPVT